MEKESHQPNFVEWALAKFHEIKSGRAYSDHPKEHLELLAEVLEENGKLDEQGRQSLFDLSELQSWLAKAGHNERVGRCAWWIYREDCRLHGRATDRSELYFHNLSFLTREDQLNAAPWWSYAEEAVNAFEREEKKI